MSEQILAKNISCTIGTKKILHEIDFSAGDKELHVILGHNGSGKTTFFNILTGSIPFFSGQLVIQGRGVTPGRKRRVFPFGIIFQHNNLIADLTVGQNVALGRIRDFEFVETFFYRLNRNRLERVNHILEVTNLVNLRDRKVGHLSGGERQRTAIARALMQDADVVLADEPVSALDPKSSEQCMQLLMKARHEFSRTVIVILHQLEIARDYGERFTGFREGRIAFGGVSREALNEHLEELY